MLRALAGPEPTRPPRRGSAQPGGEAAHTQGESKQGALLGGAGEVNELLPTCGRLQSQVADKARQVKEIIFIIQLPGLSLSKLFLKAIQEEEKRAGGKKNLRETNKQKAPPQAAVIPMPPPC